jgi:integrase
MSRRGSVTKRQRRKGVAYEARWYEDDVQRSRTFTTAADANAFLNDTLARLARGDNVTWVGDRISLQDWYEEWLTRPIRPSTRSRDRGVMERWWLPTLQDHLLTKIKRHHIQGVVDRMSATLAPSTVATNYGVMRDCMAAAVNEDMVARTPCRGIKLPAKDTTKTIRFLEPEELDRLADAIDPYYRALIYIAGVIGLRWSECVGLVVSQVDLLQRTLTVDRTLTEVRGVLHLGPPKTKAGRRTITLPPFVVNELAAHLKLAGLTAANSDSLVFTSPQGGPMLRANFGRRTWNPAVKASGLRGLTFHGLRHTAAGLMVAGGYSPAIIQQRLGHASIRTTMDIYGHLLPSADASVAAGLEAMWSSRTTTRSADESS